MAPRSKRDGDKCRKHPNYQAKQEPYPTKAYPRGCPTCWEIYNEKTALAVFDEPEEKQDTTALVEAGKATRFKKGNTLTPAGVPQKTIKEYIKMKTKQGKSIADCMMEIAGIAPGGRGSKKKQEENKLKFQTKDRLTALKWLHAAGFDFDEDGDKDRPIQIVNYGEIYVGPRPPS